mmetsp:Transcript_63457/g.71051  ORF Transcript_63457/g.71051 Transcript_63457/m.71051 type:complete len:122 (-) Transcript_63457:69-434(-)
MDDMKYVHVYVYVYVAADVFLHHHHHHHHRQQQQQQQQANKDARHQFIHSRKGRNYYMDEKQLRIQLWDAFRLTRVILGTPIKDKMIHHNSILHSIQQVAEMKLKSTILNYIIVQHIENAK